MTTKRKITQIARMMYKNSFTGEYLDEKKVIKILNSLTTSKIQGIVKILKTYKRLIEVQIAHEQLTIISPVKLEKHAESEIMTKTGARKINYQINKNLVFGAKILHGDWVYDNTLDSKLDLISQDSNMTM